MSPEQSVSQYSTVLDDWFYAFCKWALAMPHSSKLFAQSELAWLLRDSFHGNIVGIETAQKFGESPIVTGGK